MAVVFSIAAPMIATTNDIAKRRAIMWFLGLAVILAILANFFDRSWSTLILTVLVLLVGVYCLVLGVVFYLSDDKDSHAYLPLFAVGLTILGAFGAPRCPSPSTLV